MKITPDEITVVPKDNLKSSGAIWESNVIDHNIEISNEGINYFGNFIKYALKKGVTTNYIVGGVGTSYARRQQIVKFGYFWSRCISLKIKPKQIIGKMLFEDDFSEDEWNSFYN